MSRKDDVLAMIAESGEVSMKQVSEKLGISPANASVLLARLHREYVIARTGAEKAYRYSMPTEQVTA